ncbi:MAG: condensation domain-containing protein, partial [Acidobacteriota bacterium]
MSDLENRIANLSPEKLAALRKKLKEKKGETSFDCIQYQSRSSNLFPLSFGQQRLWFINQFDNGSSIYNSPFAFSLKGQLNTEALEQSLDQIFKRHESLRTTFSTLNGQLFQSISPYQQFRLPQIDLSNLDNSKRREQAKRIIQLESERPFDLTSGPLFRALLLRLDEQEHILFLSMHHIIFDGWSLGILLKELAIIYETLLNGEPACLPNLPIQYADFSVWQRKFVEDEVLKTDLPYWTEQLAGRPVLLELPTDRPRPPIQSYKGNAQFFTLPQSLYNSLKALSQREGTTLFMTLLTGFKILLYRYSGQKDILIGTPIANRNRSEIEGLIGYFSNTLVLRMDLSGNPTVREALSRVQQTTLGALAHQDLPFQSLVEALQPERSLSHTPLFQVFFSFRNDTRSINFAGLRLTRLNVYTRTTRTDITMSLEETENGLEGGIEYNLDLFDSNTISKMLEHFRKLLESIVIDLDQPISSIPLLLESERQQLLMEWNKADVTYQEDKNIAQLFEEQVERTPDAVALTFNQQQLTYQQLNLR